MYFLVKIQLAPDKVDEFTHKLANGEIHGVEGNLT